MNEEPRLIKVAFPQKQASLASVHKKNVQHGHIFNQKKAEAITRFFQRSGEGTRFDSILQTPFFAISQSHNVGLQLADIITTVIGLRFEGSVAIQPYFEILKRSIPGRLELGSGHVASGLKVLRDHLSPINGKKKIAPDGPKTRGRDKKAQLPAQRNKTTFPSPCQTEIPCPPIRDFTACVIRSGSHSKPAPRSR